MSVSSVLLCCASFFHRIAPLMLALPQAMCFVPAVSGDIHPASSLPTLPVRKMENSLHCFSSSLLSSEVKLLTVQFLTFTSFWNLLPLDNTSYCVVFSKDLIACFQARTSVPDFSREII